MKRPLLFVIMLALSSPAIAQQIQTRPGDQIDLLTYTPPEVYQGQMTVRVRTTSQPQLDALLELVESVWTERVGVGPLVVQIKRSNLSAITALGIPHDVLIEDLQAHTDASWTRMVDAQRAKEANPPNANRGVSVHDDQWFANYQQLNDITSYINNIASMRPDLASTMIIGQSYEGRDLFAITITGPDTPTNLAADRPVVYIFSNVHAREWIAPMTTTYFASKFVEEYDTDLRTQAILDSTRIVIVPVGNPDGYLYTWSNERFWRKNRRDNFTGAYGVDINRNWGYEWGGQGSSDWSFSNTYRGTAPFSEFETQALRDLALSFGDKLKAHIDYHSFSQLILWPFGYVDGVITPEPYGTYFDLLAREIADEIRSVHGVRYNPIQSVDLYAAAGDSSDWFFGELSVSSLTVELRPDVGGFAPPPSTILPNAQENYFGFKRYIERTTQSIFLTHSNAPTTASEVPVSLTMTAIDGAQSIDPTTATLFTRSCPQCPFEPIAMTTVGDGQYAGTAPTLACGDSMEYYFQITSTIGTTFTLPSDGNQTPLAMLAEDRVQWYSDTLEIDTGWTVGDDLDEATSGIWTRMDPQGNNAQPEDDHTPEGTICWVTDGVAGVDLNDRDVDGGGTTLTSPSFDATSPGEPILSFWYAIKTGFGSNNDELEVKLSNDDGQTWIDLVELVSTDRAWELFSIPLKDFIEPTDQMRIRFVMYDRLGDQVVEAAVDDLRVEFIGCAVINPADLNKDGSLDFFDVSIFLDAFANENPLADFNMDGQWNFYDVSAFLDAFTQ